jgi:hypothetical protein
MNSAFDKYLTHPTFAPILKSQDSRIKVLSDATQQLISQWIVFHKLPDGYQDLISLFKAAHSCSLIQLKDIVASRIAKDFTNPSTAKDILRMGHRYQNEVLINKAEAVLKKYDKYTRFPDWHVSELFNYL